jgi:hypothetical protein
MGRPEEGLAVALDERPLIDDLDCDILKVIAQSPLRLIKIAAQVGVCKLTARRRLDLLIERGLVNPDAGKFYMITAAGIAVIGVNTPKLEPWVRREMVAASIAKDVMARSPNDDRSSAFRSKVASLGGQQSMATARLHKRRRSAFGDLDMAG